MLSLSVIASCDAFPTSGHRLFVLVSHVPLLFRITMRYRHLPKQDTCSIWRITTLGIALNACDVCNPSEDLTHFPRDLRAGGERSVRPCAEVLTFVSNVEETRFVTPTDATRTIQDSEYNLDRGVLI